MKHKRVFNIITFTIIGVIIGALAIYTSLIDEKGADGTFNPYVITKRFGECPTCDVKGVTENAFLPRGGTVFTEGSQILALNSRTDGSNSPIIMKFDLSTLQGKTIKSAKLKVFSGNFTKDSIEGESYKAPIVKLTNTVNNWDDAGGLSYSSRGGGAGWTSSGNIDTAYNINDKIGELYFKHWLTGEGTDAELWDGLSSLLDINTVQDWVQNPTSNQGFIMLPKTLPVPSLGIRQEVISKDFPDTYGGAGGYENMRPYLEVTYEDTPEAVAAETQPQPTNVQAHYHAGQTFITWKEIVSDKDETVYRIYRSTSPITNLGQAELVDQVYQGSSWIREFQTTFLPVQPDVSRTGATLAQDSGLYVYSAKAGSAGNPVNAYYAVTSVVEGNENLIISNNTTADPAQEHIDYPEPYFTSGFSGYTRPIGIMWLGDYNWNDPSDQYGFHSKKSAPYLFTVVFPEKLTRQAGVSLESAYRGYVDINNPSTEKFPLTVMLHASGGSMYYSSMTTYDSAYKDENSYGGFTIGFDDSWSDVLRIGDGFEDRNFVWDYTLSNGNGNAYYAGWNSNYIERGGLLTKSCIKTLVGGVYKCVPSGAHIKRPDNLEIEKRFEDGRSIMYSEKSILFVKDTLEKRSPWKNRLDNDRVYLSGGSLGAGGGLTLGYHHPEKFSAIDIFNPQTKRTEIDYHGRNLDLWGPLALNIKTQDGVDGPNGVGIYDYLDMEKYIQSHRAVDLPYVQATLGKQDMLVDWARNFPFYFRSNKDSYLDGTSKQNSRLGLRVFWDASCHVKDCQGRGSRGDNSINWNEQLLGFWLFNNPVAWPDYLTLNNDSNVLWNASTTQSLPYFNVFKLKTKQSYPAFSNFSHDDNPGSLVADIAHTCEAAIDDKYPDLYHESGKYLCDEDMRGAVNRFQIWEPNTIVDGVNNYSINLRMIDLSQYVGNSAVVLPHGDVSASETTDVTLRRLQNFPRLQTGQSYQWKNLRSDNSEIQSGLISYDQFIRPETEEGGLGGLLTIRDFQIQKAGSKLTIELIDDGSTRISMPSSYSTYKDMEISIDPDIANRPDINPRYQWSGINLIINPSDSTTTSFTNIKSGNITGAPPNPGHILSLKVSGGNPVSELATGTTTIYIHKLADIDGERNDNGSFDVDFDDFAALLFNWGTPTNPMANINRTSPGSEDDVDFDDFAALLFNWGR